MTATAYIALGANLGDREHNLLRTLDLLRQNPGIEVKAVSSIMENPAVGGPPDSPPFLNAAAELRTDLGPRELLVVLLGIEKELGRTRREKWEPRLIDLDLLLHDKKILDTPVLKLPHPLMHTRRFVLEPLAQLAPDLIHPLLHKSVSQLLREL